MATMTAQLNRRNKPGGVLRNETKSIRFSIQNFMNHKTGDSIDSHYNFGKVLGEGAFGEVFLCTNRKTNDERAVKKMEKDDRDPFITEEILHEFQVLKELDHPNVLKVYDLFEEPSYFYIVTDLYGGGDLFDYLEEREVLPEIDVKIFMNKLLSCITYLHHKPHPMVHRDLKLENILLDTNRDLRDMKLIDFGLAQNFNPTQPDTMTFDALVGSTSYIAPQVVEGQYTSKCDIWSCGVIAYCLLAGYTPFDAPDDGQVIQAILVGTFDFDDPAWDNVSDEAKDFICNLLAYEESERPTAEQALTHPWLQKLRKKELKESDKDRKRSIRESLTALRRFTSKGRKLKQACCAILASQFVKKHEKELFNDGFRYLDKSLAGCIIKDDMKSLFTELAGSSNDAVVDAIFEQVNTSGEGAISYSEYAIAMMFERDLVEDKLPLVFEIFDHNGDGLITIEDLEEALHLQRVACISMLAPFKDNGKNGINLDEFKNAILPKPDDMEGSVRDFDIDAMMDESSKTGDSTRKAATITNENVATIPNEDVKSPKTTTDKPAPDAALDVPLPKEPKRMSIAKLQDLYMWYGRFGQPTREKMVQKVIRLQRSNNPDCRITAEEVDALPWIAGGALLNLTEMNRINSMKPEKEEDSEDEDETSSSSDSSESSYEESLADETSTTAKPSKRSGARLKLSTVLSRGSSSRGLSRSLTIETNVDDTENAAGGTIVRTREPEPRAENSIFSSKKKPEADWNALGQTKFLIASFEERKKMQPAFDWKPIVTADLQTKIRAYKARLAKLQEKALMQRNEGNLKDTEIRKQAKAAVEAEEALREEEHKRREVEDDHQVKEAEAKLEAERLQKFEKARIAEVERLQKLQEAQHFEKEQARLEATAKEKEEAARLVEEQRLAEAERLQKLEKARLVEEEKNRLDAAARLAEEETSRLEEATREAEATRLAEGEKISFQMAARVDVDETAGFKEEESVIAIETGHSETEGKKKFKPASQARSGPRTTIYKPSVMSDESKNRKFPTNRRRSTAASKNNHDMDSSSKMGDSSRRSSTGMDSSSKLGGSSRRSNKKSPKD